MQRSSDDLPPPAGLYRTVMAFARMPMLISQRFGAICALQTELFDFYFIQWTYHCRRALAVDRIKVAIRYMPSTKAISTKAVPY